MQRLDCCVCYWSLGSTPSVSRGRKSWRGAATLNSNNPKLIATARGAAETLCASSEEVHDVSNRIILNRHCITTLDCTKEPCEHTIVVIFSRWCHGHGPNRMIISCDIRLVRQTSTTRTCVELHLLRFGPARVATLPYSGSDEGCAERRTSRDLMVYPIRW